MEWITCIRKSIDYMEAHLTEDIRLKDIADQVYVSPHFLQKGFAIMTGFTPSEYVRSRRLYLAALALQKTDEKIIDMALRFGYETPESFNKAFTRFHGVSPSQVRNGAPFRRFLPLTVDITIRGGLQMNYKIAKMFPFKVIGFERGFTGEEAQKMIPLFWSEICEKYAANVYAGNPPANAYEKALMDNCIGEYGICIDDLDGSRFRYLIAGKYCGGEVPEGMVVCEFPRADWAVFDCIGPNPETLQKTTTRIFTEWLPGNPDYEMDGNMSVEWYDCLNGEMTDPDYHSAVWIPVRKK